MSLLLAVLLLVQKAQCRLLKDCRHCFVCYSSVLVTFLLLWENTVTKTIYKRKCLIWSSQFRRDKGHGHYY